MSTAATTPADPERVEGPAGETIAQVLAAIGMITGPLRPVTGTADQALESHFGIDSLGRQCLASELEDALDRPISEADIAAWETPADVARTIDRLKGLPV